MKFSENKIFFTSAKNVQIFFIRIVNTTSDFIEVKLMSLFSSYIHRVDLIHFVSLFVDFFSLRFTGANETNVYNVYEVTCVLVNALRPNKLLLRRWDPIEFSIDL